jgi:hypothetical protein
MDAGLVLDVRDLSLATDPSKADNLPVVDGDPGVSRQPLGPLGPPFAKLGSPELDGLLVEIGAIALRDERGYGRRVVQRRGAESEVVQSGWPDSNRRLLRPKRSTLTRLSYTPNGAPSVVR